MFAAWDGNVSARIPMFSFHFLIFGWALGFQSLGEVNGFLSCLMSPGNAPSTSPVPAVPSGGHREAFSTEAGVQQTHISSFLGRSSSVMGWQPTR